MTMKSKWVNLVIVLLLLYCGGKALDAVRSGFGNDTDQSKRINAGELTGPPVTYRAYDKPFTPMGAEEWIEVLTPPNGEWPEVAIPLPSIPLPGFSVETQYGTIAVPAFDSPGGVITIGGSGADAPYLTGSSSAAKVVRVVDGDTIVVETDGVEERVRVIGIDTPETVNPNAPVGCFGPEASAFAKGLLPAGTEVQLRGDPTTDDYDRYGRRLAYIEVEARDYGLIMISTGHAKEYTYDKAYGMQLANLQAEMQAQKDKAGLWSKDTCGGVTD